MDAAPTLLDQTHVLFLARRSVDHPDAEPRLRDALQELCRSENAAVATEAGRLFGALERRRLGCGDSA